MTAQRARRLVLTAAGLAAAGVPPSYIGAIVECAAQSSDPASGAGAALLAACLGIVAGLWLPRRVISRKLSRNGGWAASGRRRDADDADSTSDLSATIAATVTLFAAAALAAQVYGVAVTERYRLTLTQAVMMHAALAWALLWIPVIVGIGLVSACVTMSISALVGLLRTIADGPPRVAQLWLIMLVCATAGTAAGSGATLMEWKPGQVAAATLGLTLPTFLAGVMLIITAPRMWITNCEPGPMNPIAAFGGRAPPAAGVATASAMIAFVCCASKTWPNVDWVVAPLMAAALALSAPIAHFIGRRWGASRGKLATILLLIASIWIAPLDAAMSSSASGPARCAMLAFLAGMMLVLAARRATARTGNIQTAIYAVGIWCARCGAVAMFIPIVLGSNAGAALIAPWIASGLCIVAMYYVYARTHPTAGNRLRGASPATRRIATIAALLILIAGFVVRYPAKPSPEKAGARAEPPTFPRDRVAVCRPNAGAASAEALDGAVGFGPEIDLQPARFDLIVIRDVDRLATERPDALVRLIRRCDAALLDEGRLLIESSEESVAFAARRAASRLDSMSRPMVHRVTVSRPRQTAWSAISIAADVEAWLRDSVASQEGMVRIERQEP